VSEGERRFLSSAGKNPKEENAAHCILTGMPRQAKNQEGSKNPAGMNGVELF